MDWFKADVSVYFFKKYFGEISPFCGAVLDFWWRLPWFSKAWESLVCVHRHLHAMESSDSPLVRRLPKSWQPAWHPSHLIHILVLVGFESLPPHSAKLHWTSLILINWTIWKSKNHSHSSEIKYEQLELMWLDWVSVERVWTLRVNVTGPGLCGESLNLESQCDWTGSLWRVSLNHES